MGGGWRRQRGSGSKGGKSTRWGGLGGGVVGAAKGLKCELTSNCVSSKWRCNTTRRCLQMLTKFLQLCSLSSKEPKPL